MPPEPFGDKNLDSSPDREEDADDKVTMSAVFPHRLKLKSASTYHCFCYVPVLSASLFFCCFIPLSLSDETSS